MLAHRFGSLISRKSRRGGSVGFIIAWNGSLFVSVTAMLALLVGIARAQLFKGGRLLRPPPEQQEDIAYVGEPYGVGRWTVRLPAGVNPALLGGNIFTLTEKNGRAVFAAFQAEPFRTVARELLGRPQTATVYFLFTGGAPLELQLYSPTATATTINPRRDPVQQAKLLSDWWVQYTRQGNRIDRPADYPGLVDNYLLATLARRLNLPPETEIPPPPIRLMADNLLGSLSTGGDKLPVAKTNDEQFDREIGLLLGSDGLRSQMQTQVLQPRAEPIEPADQPVPEALNFATKVPEVLGDVAIEPIALHVPADCFYVRYGNFTNYLWFRHTLDRWSGDLKNLVNRRGLDFEIAERIQQQLSLRESVLAPVFGPAVIADVAMIGDDMFFHDGASMGFLFQARNSLAVNADFTRQRAATLQNVPGCTQEQVDIAGHKVSFLSTPDNRVRSFYAIDGDYHFVTNSRHLVQEFYAAGAGKNGLGSTAEFRYARSLEPIKNDYTVFAYLSADFFRNLMGPHYQMEMARRLQSAAEIDMAMVAQVLAHTEGHDAKSLEELIKGQYLPESFGQRVDGSRLEMKDGGEFVDSLRGARGSFAPVSDIEFDRITAGESQRYHDFTTWFQSKWSQVDPVVAGIRREPSRLKEPGVERIVLDVQLTPLAAKNYETIAKALGPLSKQRLAAVPGDVLSGEAVMSGNLLASKGLVAAQGAYRLFGALRDEAPEVLGSENGGVDNPRTNPAGNQPPITIGGPGGRGFTLNGPLGAVINNALAGAQGMPTLSPLSLLPPFYFGAYPTPALFSWMGVGDVPLDANGYGRSLTSGLWQRRSGNFTTASMQREILEAVTPQLKFVDAARPAQGWFHAGDLSRSKLAPLVNGLFYAGAKNAAIGNVRFLHSLATQLRVPSEDCLKVAEQLTGAKFVDPIGGKYQLDQRGNSAARWVSTALPSERMRLIDDLFTPPPAGFTAPVLNWLRAADGDLAVDQRLLSLHAEVEMQQNSGATVAAKATGPALEAPPQPKRTTQLSEEIPPPPPQPAR